MMVKRFFAGTFAVAAFVLALSLLCPSIQGSRDEAFAAEGQGKKILVVWFSRTGNTREVANLIHARVGGDLVEIKMADPYPADDAACGERVTREQKSNARPKLATKIENFGSYDLIFVGHPIWQGTLPPPLFTFFESYDFSGKTVVPFCTYGGTGAAQSVADIARLAPKAKLLEGFGIQASNMKNAPGEVTAWLKKIGLGQ